MIQTAWSMLQSSSLNLQLMNPAVNVLPAELEQRSCLINSLISLKAEERKEILSCCWTFPMILLTHPSAVLGRLLRILCSLQSNISGMNMNHISKNNGARQGYAKSCLLST